MFKILALLQPKMQLRKMTVWESLAKNMQATGGHLYPVSFAEYTGHSTATPKGQGHSFQSTKFYVLNIIYPTVQAPSCVSGSTSQEHLHIDNTQYQDCCRGDSWRRSESYPQ